LDQPVSYFRDHLSGKLLQSKDEEWTRICKVVATNEFGFVDSIEDHSIDIVFVCDVYHHIEYPKAVLKDILRILKRGGTMILIDFYRDSSLIKSFPAGFIEAHVRADKDVFRSEVEDAGFELIEDRKISGLHDNYFLVFKS
jgi:SAM-dependent methyltransferase